MSEEAAVGANFVSNFNVPPDLAISTGIALADLTEKTQVAHG
jgi:hypothetical protein